MTLRWSQARKPGARGCTSSTQRRKRPSPPLATERLRRSARRLTLTLTLTLILTLPYPNPNLEEVSFEEFCGAVRLVGSRCLRLSMGWEHGVRRLLVPVFDLANHDGQAPSAMYSSANLRS